MVSSESDFKLNGVSQETVYYLSSNDTRFKYPAVFVVGDNALNDVITVTNVVTSPYEKLNF